MSSSVAESSSFSAVEKWFIFFSMVTGFFISVEYASIRPSSSALFLSIFSFNAIPWVWLASMPINFLAVYGYNRFLPKIGPLKMVGWIAAIIIVFHTYCAFFLWWTPKLILFEFMLKDIYMLLMFKQLWSMIHSTIHAKRAKYLYGCIFGVGTLGAIVGSFIPWSCAVKVGSEKLFLCSLPCYFILYLAYAAAFKRSALNTCSFSQDLTLDPRPSEGFALIKKSPFLIAALLLVIFMQVSVGFMDYQFNASLAENILDKDLRTEYVGKIVGCVNTLSLILQFVGGFFMIHLFGVRGSHLLVPLLLIGNAALLWIAPTFSMISFGYVFIKAIDFSLFGIAREMLYIPMKMDEKFRSKAIIDVFAYRSSKAFVSIFILCLQCCISSNILPFTQAVSIVVLLAWLIFVWIWNKRQQACQSYFS